MKVLFLAAIMLLAASVLPHTHAASTKADANVLRALEAEFMKAAAERGSQGYMSYYAEDAVELPNGEDRIQGKINIARTMTFLDDKNNHLTWTPEGADISADGGLGYTYGAFEFSSMSKEGKPVSQHGKYTSIWKTQGDGSWKVVLDMGNSNQQTKPQ